MENDKALHGWEWISFCVAVETGYTGTISTTGTSFTSLDGNAISVHTDDKIKRGLNGIPEDAEIKRYDGRYPYAVATYHTKSNVTVQVFGKP